MSTKKIDLVLLIDDNEVTNYYNSDLVRSLGIAHDVRSFTDPVHGLEFLTAQLAPGGSGWILLLCDIRMPGYTGFDLLTELEDRDLAETPRLVVCLLTSSNMVRDREELVKFPEVKAFLQKPLDRTLLDGLLAFFP